MRLLTTFVPACAHAFQALCLGVRSITQLSNLNFQGLVIFTDGGMETANGDTTAGCARPGPILSRFYVCDVRASGHFPLFAGASRHTNNTDELSGFIIFVFNNFSQIKGLCLEVPMFVFCCFKSRFQTPQRNHAPVQQCTPCEPCTAFSSDR